MPAPPNPSPSSIYCLKTDPPPPPPSPSSYCLNLCLKMNPKLGGTNTTINDPEHDPKRPRWLPMPLRYLRRKDSEACRVMVLGIDVCVGACSTWSWALT